jgi:nucleoside-diphosphate-sugar epimerase
MLQVIDATILVTGSAGLIGRAVVARLRAAGAQTRGLDLRKDAPARGDIRDAACLARALADVDGVVHLAAVSRVIWGEQDPPACWAVNVDATRRILDLARAAPRRPWVIYASSREVYGEQDAFPVPESAPPRPLNVYARSKVAAEVLTMQARASGLRSAIVRFSSVYGSVRDHPDRVVPAFAAAAVRGGVLRMEGADNGFDFTHVDDVAAGVVEVARHLHEGERSLPALHFVSGVRTSLRDLAELAASAGASVTHIVEAPPRQFDVRNFHGDPRLAERVLGWRARVPLHDGLAGLVRAFGGTTVPRGQPALPPQDARSVS